MSPRHIPPFLHLDYTATFMHRWALDNLSVQHFNHLLFILVLPQIQEPNTQIYLV